MFLIPELTEFLNYHLRLLAALIAKRVTSLLIKKEESFSKLNGNVVQFVSGMPEKP